MSLEAKAILADSPQALGAQGVPARALRRSADRSTAKSVTRAWRAVTAAIQRRFASAATRPRRERSTKRLREFAADFWRNHFFFFLRFEPWYAIHTRWFYLWFAFRYSRVSRRNLLINAARFSGLPPPLVPEDGLRLAASVPLARRSLGAFYSFIADVGQSSNMPVGELLAHVEKVEGHDAYLAARAAQRGAIVLTAHMGSFEVGIAALRRMEKKVHIVFKRDQMQRFEELRHRLHQRLGVIEAPLDDGWGIWIGLRDALRNDEVVVMQGDRVMPGQKGQLVPFLGGHLELPTGPLKLALASGAPIVPTFSMRRRTGQVRLFIEGAIEVGPEPMGSDDAPHPALLKLAALLEKYVRRYPEQWLMLTPALVEDAAFPSAEADPQAWAQREQAIDIAWGNAGWNVIRGER